MIYRANSETWEHINVLDLKLVMAIVTKINFKINVMTRVERKFVFLMRNIFYTTKCAFPRHTRILFYVQLHHGSINIIIWLVKIKRPIRALPVRPAETPVASKFTILLPQHSWLALTTILWVIDQPSPQNFFCFVPGHLSWIIMCFPGSEKYKILLLVLNIQ